MQHSGLCGPVALVSLFLSMGSVQALAGSMPSQALQASQTLYQQDFDMGPAEVADGRVLAPGSQPAFQPSSRPSSPALSINPAGKIATIPALLQVPASQPACIVFDVAARKPGRLVVHLQPAELPKAFDGKVEKEDWADPHRHFDFRALIDLPQGKWQQFSIDLNTRFFEAITRDKKPLDLAGLKIRSIGFEVNQPGDPDQRVLIDNVRIVEIGPKARTIWLQACADELRARIEKLPADSAIGKHWQGVLDEGNKQLATFDPQIVSLDDWREAKDTLDRMLLASGKWSLPGAADAAYLVGTETSLRRISASSRLYTFSGQIGKPVSLESARNEYECFQVVLLPLSDHLKGVTVALGDLKQLDGKGVIPAKNIAAYHQIEQRIQPSLRTTDDQVGWTPDALLPVTGPFDVSDIQTKPLWVTVHVPADAVPGDYTGKITLKPANAPERSLDLNLKVYDITIPRVGQFRTQGHFAITSLQDWYGDKYSPEVRKAFYRLMVEHRFSPTSQYSRMLSPVDEDIPWVMAEGGNVIVIGGYHTKPLEPEKIATWYEWLVKNSYVEKALIYIGDETDDYRGIRAKAETVRRNWPELRIMVGGSKPRPELIGYVDVWDPITSGGSVYDFDAKGAKEAQARGEEVFWYTCIGPRQPYANVCNDDPLTATRALWWQAWKYGITGFEYWAMNQWGGNMALAKGDKPWPLGRTGDWDSRSYSWCNGDGLMVYPGPDGQPLSCNRFDVMRDAIEDWEVLFQLQRAVELAGKTKGTPDVQPLIGQSRRLLDVPAQITTDLTHWSDDPQVYLKYRHDLYELLSALRAKLGPQKVDEYTAQWATDNQRWLQERFSARVAKFKEQG